MGIVRHSLPSGLSVTLAARSAPSEQQPTESATDILNRWMGARSCSTNAFESTDSEADDNEPEGTGDLTHTDTKITIDGETINVATIHNKTIDGGDIERVAARTPTPPALSRALATVCASIETFNTCFAIDTTITAR